jgi:hypothetical protein
LDDAIASSTMPFHEPDGNGGFYTLSAKSSRSGHPIEYVLNGHEDHIVAVMELCSEATALFGNFTAWRALYRLSCFNQFSRDL